MGRIFFDVETTGLFPNGRITCVVTEFEGRAKIWATPGKDDGTYTLLSEAAIEELVAFMESNGADGHGVVSYNGSSFDFKMLANQAKCTALKERIKRLALNHYDMHLACMVERGHRMKLDGLAKATLGSAKSGSGLDAIKYWKEKDYGKLFDYCGQDVVLLRDLYNLVENGESLQFESARGNLFDVNLKPTFGMTADELSKQTPNVQPFMKEAKPVRDVFDWI